jgi:CYTH domain-containing protein
MALEIERKFILTRLPRALLQEARAEPIRQGYLVQNGDRELRIRQRGERYWMTVKQGSGLARQEHECEIPATQFEMLWPLTAGHRIEKTRYTMEQQGHQLEIDRFHGELAPLLLLEIEFDSVAASRDFPLPDAVLREVTEDPDYKNAALATRGLPATFPHGEN